MLSDLQQRWQSGLEARHIEELVGNIFADFAPYAGADTSRLTITRQRDMEALSSLAVDENNNVSVHFANLRVANILFDSRGVLQPTVALRLPLCHANSECLTSSHTPIDTRTPTTLTERTGRGADDTNCFKRNDINIAGNTGNDYIDIDKNHYHYLLYDTEKKCMSMLWSKYDSPDLDSQAPLRYVSFPRGAELLYGLPLTITGHKFPANTFGQFEFNATLPVIWQDKVSYGMRAGCGAFRITHHQHTLPGAHANQPAPLSTSTEGQDVNNKDLHVMQHTLDLAWTFPFAGRAPCNTFDKRGKQSHHEGNLGIAPWVCTVGFQHPEPFGDTLIAFAVQNDRVTSSAAALPSRRVIEDRNTVAVPLYASPTLTSQSNINNNDHKDEEKWLIASDDVETLQGVQEISSNHASNAARNNENNKDAELNKRHNTMKNNNNNQIISSSSSSACSNNNSKAQDTKEIFSSVQKEAAKVTNSLTRNTVQPSSTLSKSASSERQRRDSNSKTNLNNAMNTKMMPKLNHDGTLLVEGDDVETLQAIEEDASLIAAEANELKSQPSLFNAVKEGLVSFYHKAENVITNSSANNVSQLTKHNAGDEHEGKLLVEGDDVESLQAMQEGLTNQHMTSSGTRRKRQSKMSMLRNAELDKNKTRFGIPFYSFRAVLVQTLLSRSILTNPQYPNRNSDFTGDMTNNALHNHYRVISSDKPWNQLPTLVGCNIGFAEDLVKLNAAAIVHDGYADLELSTVFDLTPISKSIPTLVKVGWNNTGRVAVGITSLIGEVMNITLGIHHARNEHVRFGLEVKV